MSDILCRHYHDEPLVRSRLDDFRSLMDVADLTGHVLDGAFSFGGRTWGMGSSGLPQSSSAPRPSSCATHPHAGD